MSLTLLDWRRRIARLYAEVRSEPDPVAAHAHWRATRDQLLRSHPDSPIPPPERAAYPGAPIAAYDPALRFDVIVDTSGPARHLEVRTGTDGVAPFDRIGCAHLPGGGELDVWWLGSYGGGVFVPFKDASAGTASYGGGRYLIDTAKGAGSRRRPRPPDPRLQLRLQPVLRLRPHLGLPAGPGRQHPQSPAAGRGESCRDISGGQGWCRPAAMDEDGSGSTGRVSKPGKQAW